MFHTDSVGCLAFNGLRRASLDNLLTLSLCGLCSLPILQSRYSVDATNHNGLRWQNLFPSVDFITNYRRAINSLLNKPVEKHSSGFGGPAVKTKGELVQIEKVIVDHCCPRQAKNGLISGGAHSGGKNRWKIGWVCER
jgi:hypothetical protein